MAERLVPTVVVVVLKQRSEAKLPGVRGAGGCVAGQREAALVSFQIRERLSIQNVTDGKQASVEVPASRPFCGYA